MPDFTLVCPDCKYPQLIPAGHRSYDLVRCGNCAQPLTGEVDVLGRIGEWRREMARELLGQQWEQYLDGSRGEFQMFIARALRIADPINEAKIREAWPLLYAAWEMRA